MSYINKPGKTTASRLMIIRQQVTDMIAYHEIKTTLTKAKETQKHIEKLITLSKKDTIANRRLATKLLLDNQKICAKDAIKYLFETIGPVFKNRAGGYTRVLKLGKRQGDATEIAILQFVDKIPAFKKKTKVASKKDSPALKVETKPIVSNV
ncbi:50S ribosomal protein L17 [Mycoplasmoides alvi]|uniref:50S ribosomal protein L17 n=1 Tax=Mycoplasmoides alvi TaxID=78580 RepID=UPI00051C017D